MPLVKCDGCKKDVSDTAEVCPHCGHPQPKRMADDGQPHAHCECCQALNLLPFENPQAKCRGCGRSLREVCAEHYEQHRLAAIFDDASHAALNATGVAVPAFLTLTLVVWAVFTPTNPVPFLLAAVAVGSAVCWGVWWLTLSVYLSTIGVRTFRAAYPDSSRWHLRDVSWWRNMSIMHKNRYRRRQ